MYQRFFLRAAYLWSPATLTKTKQYEKTFSYQKRVSPERFCNTCLTLGSTREIYLKIYLKREQSRNQSLFLEVTKIYVIRFSKSFDLLKMEASSNDFLELFKKY